jgi:hypothetical protein
MAVELNPFSFSLEASETNLDTKEIQNLKRKRTDGAA